MSENTETLTPAAPPQEPSSPAEQALINQQKKEGVVTGTQPPAPALGQDAPGKGTQGGEQKSEEGKPAQPPPADIELKFAQGVEVDTELVGEFKKVAKELGLDSPKAQKLADMYVARQQKSVDTITNAWKTTQMEWQKANRADPEYGGKDYDANVEIARNAVHRLDPSGALRKEIDALGVGDNPHLLKAFIKVGRSIQEDAIGRDGKPPSEAETEMKLHRKLYPSMFNPDGSPKTE